MSSTVAAISTPNAAGGIGIVKISGPDAISVAERQNYIFRVRNLARIAAEAYCAQRERLGYPLIKDEAKRAAMGLSPLKGGK